MFSYWVWFLYFGNKNQFFTKVFQIPPQKVFWVGFWGPNISSRLVFGSLGFEKNSLSQTNNMGFSFFCSKVLHDEKEASTCRKAQRKNTINPLPATFLPKNPALISRGKQHRLPIKITPLKKGPVVTPWKSLGFGGAKIHLLESVG